MFGMMPNSSVVLVVRIPVPLASGAARVKLQLPLSLAVAVPNDFSVSLMPSSSSRNSSMTQLGQGLPVPAVPLTAVPLIEVTLNNLGEMSVLVQDFRAALGYSQQALEIATEIQEKRTIAVCHMNMGDAWCGLGELKQAETYLQQALRTVAEIDALDFVVRIAIRLGRVYQKQNRPGPALRLLKGCLAHSAADDEARGQARAWLQELGQSSVVNSSDEELGKALRELGIQ